MNEWVKDLRRLGACEEARIWASAYRSLDEAWAVCQRADWMLWLAGKLSEEPESASRRKLVLAACACARTVLDRVPAGENRPRLAIETAERWAREERGVTLKDVRKTAYDASAAAYAASAYDAAASAAASSAASAAAYAASAYDAASYVASYAAASSILADLVREHYPTAPRIKEE